MRVPRVKMRQALFLIGVASAWLWLEMISWGVLAIGTIVLALMIVSLRNRGRVAGELQAEAGRARSLSLAGIIGYSTAALLALAWLASTWFWQVFDHESSKARVAPILQSPGQDARGPSKPGDRPASEPHPAPRPTPFTPRNAP